MGKREDIMNATLDLIDEEGLQSLTFAKIFKRANVGSGTVFNYFENKEQLVNEVYREARLLMGRSLMENYDPGAGLYERFKRLQLNRLMFAIAYPKHFRLIDTYSYTPYISAELRHMEDPSSSLEAVLAIIKEGQSQGIIREMDLLLCQQIMHGVIAAIVKGFYIQKYPLDETRIQQTIEASWKALRV